MPALARGQENTEEILNWFITVGDILTNAYEIGFRILDLTGGEPGVQIFPDVPGEYEDVTDPPGNFSTGSYYAYDNDEEQGYTPSLTASLGTHRVEWRWKISELASYQTDTEDFEVLEKSAGFTSDTYITIQNVRDAGLTDDTTFPDALVLASIELWQALLDRACRQWFKPKVLTLKADGTDSNVLHFGIPIINIEYLKINNDTVALNTALYKVYNSIVYPDDRRNPRIKLVDTREYRDIYTTPIRLGRLKFDKGCQNQEIKGTFGFVEADMSVPKLIQRALLKLVIEKLTNPVYASDPATLPPAPPPILGSILEEETDGHIKKYGTSGAEVDKRSPYMIGITDDQEIIEIIKLYRAPIGCATPAHMSYR